MAFRWRGQNVDGRALIRAIFAPERRAAYHQRFYQELGVLQEGDFLQRYVRHTLSLFDLAGQPVDGQTVLDCGTGFALTPVFLALSGAREAHGLEFQANHLDTFTAYRDLLPPDLPVFLCQGDAAALPYGEGTFDVVLSVEAISHYRDPDSFLQEAHRVLRRGGMLLISDANNGANPWRAYKTRRLWQAFENGASGETHYGHRIRKSFRERRAEIIRAAFPRLNDDEVERLAAGTSGLNKREILDAVQKYLDSGRFPQHLYRTGTCPLDPLIGHYAERLFHPLELAKQVEGYGFDVRVHAYFGGSRGGWVARANHLLTHYVPTRVGIRVARTFRIVARKR